MMKHLLTILTGMACIATVSIAHNGPKPDGQSGLVVGKPLSAIEERHSEQILNDGTRDDHPSSGLFYRDAQGRMRVESQTKAVIFDPVIGVLYSLDLKTKTYRKIPVQPGTSATIAVVDDGVWIAIGDNPQSASPASPVQPVSQEKNRYFAEELPAKMLQGIRVHGSRTTSIIPPGTFGNDHELKVSQERWYADDIKVLVKSVYSDPRVGTVSYELTNIQQAPPDPSLFLIPSGATLLVDKK
jgi:hypothetical protein